MWSSEESPTNSLRPGGATYEATIENGALEFDAQSKAWFWAPARPQSFQDRLMPAAETFDTPSASRMLVIRGIGLANRFIAPPEGAGRRRVRPVARSNHAR